jgi:hypothetical protein
MDSQPAAARHDKPTIVSMAVIASGLAVLLHEGLGHGVTAWLRGDIVTDLTSNHLSSEIPDRLVDAGGTIVNCIVGLIALLAMHFVAKRPNTRYFLWLLAALNLLPAAGYFMLSGVFDFGDWAEVIRDWPHSTALHICMALIGAAATLLFVRLLAVAIQPFAPNGNGFNTVSRLPYYAAGIFSCLAGALDPLGLKLLLISTIPAAFGGSSGLLWADSFIPKTSADSSEPKEIIQKQPAWWFAATILGIAYIWFLGRGIHFTH